MKKILIASNNAGKIERFNMLMQSAQCPVSFLTLHDANITIDEPEENGATLKENALIKARAYRNHTNLPIISNDTGFWIEGEGLIDAPKRIALGDNHEHLPKEEVTKRLVSFWKQKATDRGGKVPAAWIESFALVLPDGTEYTVESRRDVTLTDTEFGVAHPALPVRALYISNTTGKPSVEHTPEEEILELQPVTDALLELIQKID